MAHILDDSSRCARSWILLALVAGRAAAAAPATGPLLGSDGGVLSPASISATADGGLPVVYDDRGCRSCHLDLTLQEYKHSQQKGGNCYDCHLPALRRSACNGVALANSKTTSATKGSSFSLQVSVVGWRLKGPEPRLCQECHEGIGTDEPLHGAIKVGGCTACHAAHSSPFKKQLKGPTPQVCAGCHRVDTRRFVHEPVAKGQCLECHDPHSGLESPLLKETRAEVCNSCHAKQKLSPAKHQSAKGICLDCHLAHASDEKNLLKPRPVRPLRTGETPPIPEPPPAATYPDAPCAQCHAGLTAKKFRHSFFKDGTCGECHLPSEQEGRCKQPLGKGWKLLQAEPELCLSCHEGLQGDTALHKVIGMRGCTACHDPHSSDVKKELKWPANQICYRCHARKDTGETVHGVVFDRNCVACHDPHSGVKAPLLKDEPGALCAECHEAKKILPEANQHEPVVKGRCIECHNPHSTEQPHLLRKGGRALCDTCHAAGAKAPDGAPAAQTQIAAKGPTSVHLPVRSDDCQTCHEQKHSSRQKKLLNTAGPKLCLECHDALANKTAFHKPIRDKGCTECHQPHTSENKKLLKQWPVEKLCHSCHEKEKTKENLSNVHAPVKEGRCLDCHDPHSGEEAPLLKLTRAELCFDCHPQKELTDKRYLHTAVREGRCDQCHDPHASNFPKMLFAQGSELCMRCHDAKKPNPAVLASARVDLTKKLVHKPLLEKTCQECHESGHGADVKKLLKKAPPQLCYDCHDRKDNTPAVHAAVKLGDCPVCHLPHSSDYKKLAPRSREAKVCFECHQDDVSERAFIHRPVAEGRCSKCHDPHGTPFPWNLKDGEGKEQCLTCHEKMRVDVKVKHAPLERYGCTGCHDPHGAANPAMLPKPINELCNSCHRDKSDGKHASPMVRGGHVTTGDTDPRRTERTFSCASCHNPHGSDNPKLFYFGKDGFQMCEGCHGDHSGTNPTMKDISRAKRPKLPDGGTPLAPGEAGKQPAAWLSPGEDDSATARPAAGVRRTGDAGTEGRNPDAGAKPTATDAGLRPTSAVDGGRASPDAGDRASPSDAGRVPAAAVDAARVPAAAVDAGRGGDQALSSDARPKPVGAFDGGRRGVGAGDMVVSGDAGLKLAPAAGRGERGDAGAGTTDGKAAKLTPEREGVATALAFGDRDAGNARAKGARAAEASRELDPKVVQQIGAGRAPPDAGGLVADAGLKPAAVDAGRALPDAGADAGLKSAASLPASPSHVPRSTPAMIALLVPLPQSGAQYRMSAIQQAPLGLAGLVFRALTLRNPTGLAAWLSPADAGPSRPGVSARGDQATRGRGELFSRALPSGTPSDGYPLWVPAEDAGLWLPDVGAREEELSSDDPRPEWHWAFAWTELTPAECPTTDPLTLRQCHAFRALREGSWSTLIAVLMEGVVIGAYDDALLEIAARLGSGEEDQAQALALRTGLVLRRDHHPLIEALDAIILRMLRHERWNRPIPALQALAPGHALVALTGA